MIAMNEEQFRRATEAMDAETCRLTQLQAIVYENARLAYRRFADVWFKASEATIVSLVWLARQTEIGEATCYQSIAQLEEAFHQLPVDLVEHRQQVAMWIAGARGAVDSIRLIRPVVLAALRQHE